MSYGSLFEDNEDSRIFLWILNVLLSLLLIYVYGCGAVWGWIALQNLNKQTFETILTIVVFQKIFNIICLSKL